MTSAPAKEKAEKKTMRREMVLHIFVSPGNGSLLDAVVVPCLYGN